MANPTSSTDDKAASSSDSWKSNELVLDKIFGFLPIADLANVRLTCNLWNAVAGRTLAKKAVVQLTDWRFAGRQVSTEFFGAFSYPEGTNQMISAEHDMWKCPCELVGMKTRYFSIDHEQLSTQLTDTEFRPKKVVVLGYGAARRLSEYPQFQSVQQLELMAYTDQQGADMLANVSTLFPQLQALRFRNIIPDDFAEICQMGERGHKCVFCYYFSKRMEKDYRLVFASLYDQKRPLDDERCTVCASICTEAQKTASPIPKNLLTNKSNLTQLTIEISPHFWKCDWAVLASFPKLEVLEVLWWTTHPSTASRRPAQYPEHSAENSILAKMLANVSLKHLRLRIDLFWNNVANIQTVLNKLKVARLSLEIVSVRWDDNGPDEVSALVDFVAGLNDCVLESLHTFHVYTNAWDLDLLPIFSMLDTKKFFRKPTWNFIAHFNQTWCRLCKTDNSLTFQVTEGSCYAFRKVYRHFQSLVAMMNPEIKYNYAFHRVGPINDYENLNTGALYLPYFLTANWTSMEYLVCDACRDHPRFLCDLPGFRQEAQITLPQKHPQERHVRTWTFCHVPRHVLAKWTVQLVSDIAAWRAITKCECVSSDLVNRFKPLYAFQFTDVDCEGAVQTIELDPRDEHDMLHKLSSYGQYGSMYAPLIEDMYDARTARP